MNTFQSAKANVARPKKIRRDELWRRKKPAISYTSCWTLWLQQRVEPQLWSSHLCNMVFGVRRWAVFRMILLPPSSENWKIRMKTTRIS